MSSKTGFCPPEFPALPFGRGSAKVPVRARSRSDNYAAVLRLHRTQPKDRRIYTAHTGILAEPRPKGRAGNSGGAEP